MARVMPVVWEMVADIPFYFVKVLSPFNPNPRSPFAEVDLNLETYRTTTDNDVVIRLRRLFQFDEDMLPNPDKRPDNFSFFPSFLALI